MSRYIDRNGRRGACLQPFGSAMTLDRAVLMFAGFVILLSLALGYFLSPYWFLLTAFAGLNMIQASITGFCPAAMIFKLFGIKEGCAFR